MFTFTRGKKCKSPMSISILTNWEVVRSINKFNFMMDYYSNVEIGIAPETWMVHD